MKGVIQLGVRETSNEKKSTALDFVVQSNNLVEAFYDSDLTATEHKIIRYAASKIKKNPSDFPTITFDVQEFIEAAGLKGNSYHERFEKVADELTRKRIKIKSEDKIGWFPYLQALIYKDGMVELTFNSFIEPMILQLDTEFTKYNYRYIGDMKSGYTIRIFELLKQYAPIGERRFKVDTLKKMLGVEDKYAQYGQFKLRVLKQAQKELDKKEDLTFTFDEIKQGRKVVEVVFNIKVKNIPSFKPKYIENQTQFVKEVSYLLESYAFKIPEEKLSKWQGYSIEALKEVFDEVQNKKMGSPFAYISTVLKAKAKESDALVEKVNTKDEKSAKAINEFIKEYYSTEVIPDWFLLEKFVKFMKNRDFTDEEIEQIWYADKDYIEAERYIP